MEIRHVIFFIFVASAIYVYFRGKVRFGVSQAPYGLPSTSSASKYPAVSLFKSEGQRLYSS
jgi:hypothetical protein